MIYFQYKLKRKDVKVLEPTQYLNQPNLHDICNTDASALFKSNSSR